MNENMDNNPLKMHFRTVAISIKLPSNGKYWKEGSLDISSTGEYAVLPMTGRDEMILQTPDALMNGQGVVDVVESCIPAIKNAWDAPSIDIDRILIAIRIASYGDTMDFNGHCPKCQEYDTFEIDLRVFMDRNMDISVFDSPKQFGNLSFKFQPQTYSVINALNMESFEYQKLIMAIRESDIEDEEKTKRVNDIFKKITESTVHTMAMSINNITTSEGETVDNIAYIEDFLNKCDSKTFQFIKNMLDELSDELSGNDNEISVTCSNEACGNQYSIPFTFDNANFFGRGS